MPTQMRHRPIARTGTTTIGIACHDGVVLAAERRATIGSMIASKRDVKVYRLDDRLGITTAGDVGDAQALVRYLQAELALHRVRTAAPISVKAAATFAANLLSQSRFFPYIVGLIIGGHDGSGPHLFALDLAGGLIEDKFTAEGSGAPVAYGVLEDSYQPDLTVEAGLDLAIRALHAAMERDAASGDGYLVAKVTARGYELVEDEEIKRRLAKLKLP